MQKKEKKKKISSCLAYELLTSGKPDSDIQKKSALPSSLVENFIWLTKRKVILCKATQTSVL